MMEQFKELHKTVEQLRTSGLSTGEIKKVSGLLYPTCRNQSRGTLNLWVNNYLLTTRGKGNLYLMCFMHCLLPSLSSHPLPPSIVPPTHCTKVGGRVGVGVGEGVLSVYFNLWYDWPLPWRQGHDGLWDTTGRAG